MTAFLAEWTTLSTEIGARDELAEIGDDLVGRHREPHRHYHTEVHIVAVLDHLRRLGDTTPTARLAAFFHDAVYDPTRSDNEARSAELAAVELRRVGFERTGDVVALIEATAGHELPPDGPAEAAAFLDADLAILGAPQPTYDRYSTAIRAEYAHVAEDDFRSGRARILEDFLARDRLYFTPGGHDLWDAAARTNLGRELARLR